MTRKFNFIRNCPTFRKIYVKFQAGLTGVCVFVLCGGMCVCARACPYMHAICRRCTALLCAEMRWCLTRSNLNGQMGLS